MKNSLFFLLATTFLSADPKVAVQELPQRDIKMANIIDQKESISSEWLSYVNEKTTANTTGKFTTKDKFDREVIIEWTKTDIQSPDLAAFKKSISDLACKTLAPIEVEFLQKHPQAVDQEMFLKPCAPYFEKGSDAVDWEMVEEKIQSTMRQFYLTDIASFGPAVIKPLLNDVYFLVSVKERNTEKLLGFTMLAITPALAFGDIKVINLAVLPEEKDSGQDRLLMSTIFNILPKTERLFQYVRPTNATTLETYRSWGFTQNLDPIQDPNHKANMQYLILLEYKADKSNILQNTAESFSR